jgi:hypothetical protein
MDEPPPRRVALPDGRPACRADAGRVSRRCPDIPPAQAAGLGEPTLRSRPPYPGRRGEGRGQVGNLRVADFAEPFGGRGHPGPRGAGWVRIATLRRRVTVGRHGSSTDVHPATPPRVAVARSAPGGKPRRASGGSSWQHGAPQRTPQRMKASRSRRVARPADGEGARLAGDGGNGCTGGEGSGGHGVGRRTSGSAGTRAASPEPGEPHGRQQDATSLRAPGLRKPSGR